MVASRLCGITGLLLKAGWEKISPLRKISEFSHRLDPVRSFGSNLGDNFSIALPCVAWGHFLYRVNFYIIQRTTAALGQEIYSIDLGLPPGGPSRPVGTCYSYRSHVEEEEK